VKAIGTVGYFGWGNFGDELFLSAHAQALGDKFRLAPVHDLLHEPYFSRPVADVVDDFDGILIGGGDLLNPLRVSQLYWRQEYLRKPVFVYGIGVPDEPFRREPVLDVYREFLHHENCRLIVARDVESYEWMRDTLGIDSKLMWYPDPVCALDLPDPQGPPESKTLGVVMREHRSLEQDLSPLRRMLDEAKSKGYSIRHLVLANKGLGQADLQRAKMIAHPDEEVFHSEDLHEMCRQISACSMIATIKFHGLVVATMYGIPAIAMSDTAKNRNFLRLIERQEMLCKYTDSQLSERISHHPARIHSSVSSALNRHAREGYEVLRRAVENALPT
jgi:polysaccharide pyruvyl transferase WcaK-like protein